MLVCGHVSQRLWFVRLGSGRSGRRLIGSGLGLGGSLGLGILLQREIRIHNLRLLLLLLRRQLLAVLSLLLAVLPLLLAVLPLLLLHLVPHTLRAVPGFCLLAVWTAELVRIIPMVPVLGRKLGVAHRGHESITVFVHTPA